MSDAPQDGGPQCGQDGGPDSGAAPSGCGQPGEPTGRCWNESCKSLDPRQHAVWVATDPKEPWVEVLLCTECAYIIRSCSVCAYAQPVGSDDDDDTAECRKMPPPWEPVAESDWCDQWLQESVFTAEELKAVLGDGEERGQLRHLRSVSAAAESTPPEQEETAGERPDDSGG